MLMLISIQVSKDNTHFILKKLFLSTLHYHFTTYITSNFLFFISQLILFIYLFSLSLSLSLITIPAISLQTKHRHHSTQIYKLKPTPLTTKTLKLNSHQPTKHQTTNHQNTKPTLLLKYRTTTTTIETPN